jgi:hypothetical protein
MQGIRRFDLRRTRNTPAALFAEQEKSDSFEWKYSSKVIRRQLTAAAGAAYNSDHHVSYANLPRAVCMHLLLLCMRVLWRREVADLRVLS